MQIVLFPDKSEWGSYLQRPHRDASELRDTVHGVLSDIKARGDEAVKEYELKFDKVALSILAVSETEMDEAEQLVSEELKGAIQLAHDNI